MATSINTAVLCHQFSGTSLSYSIHGGNHWCPQMTRWQSSWSLPTLVRICTHVCSLSYSISVTKILGEQWVHKLVSLPGFGIRTPAITQHQQPLYLYHQAVWPLLILELLRGDREQDAVGGDPDP